MSEHSSRLVYSTDTIHGSKAAYDANIAGEITPEIQDTMDAARDLAADLGESYDAALAALLDDPTVLAGPSERVKDFLREHGMDKPRISMYTHEAFMQMLRGKLAMYSAVEHARHDRWIEWLEQGDETTGAPPEAALIPHKALDASSPDGVIVNFQLPKPLDVFWKKEQDSRATAWGSLYRTLADVPWDVVRDWEDRYESEFTVCRLNPQGVHSNGDEGFYYLFEITPVHARRPTTE